MFRILHLHPSRSDFQTRRCLELLMKQFGPDCAMASQSIGPGGDYLNLPIAALRLRALREQFDVLHAWGPGELIAGAAAGFPRLIFSPQSQPERKWWPWLSRVLRRGGVEIVAPTQYLAEWVGAQVARPSKSTVLHPGIDLARFNHPITNLRRDLGFAKDDIVLLAPGESSRDAMHGCILWAAAILKFLDPRYRVLIWGRGRMIHSLGRFTAATEASGLLVVANRILGNDIEFEQIIPAADIAIYCARPGSAILPLLQCMVAQLPIVATASPPVREFLSDQVHALIEPSQNPRRLAQRIRDMQEQASARRELIEQSRQKARQMFSAEQFVAQWRVVYGLSRSSVAVQRPTLVAAV